MNALVVPDPSERWTIVIAVAGSVTPGLRAAIFGSFQVVMVPRYIPATVSASSFRSVTPGTL